MVSYIETYSIIFCFFYFCISVWSGSAHTKISGGLKQQSPATPAVVNMTAADQGIQRSPDRIKTSTGWRPVMDVLGYFYIL